MTKKITDWMTKSSSGTREVTCFGLVGEDDASQDVVSVFWVKIVLPVL